MCTLRLYLKMIIINGALYKFIHIQMTVAADAPRRSCLPALQLPRRRQRRPGTIFMAPVIPANILAEYKLIIISPRKSRNKKQKHTLKFMTFQNASISYQTTTRCTRRRQ